MKNKYKRELLIEEHFGGRITYSSSGMRHCEEEETYYLNKGDKIVIFRKLKNRKD